MRATAKGRHSESLSLLKKLVEINSVNPFEGEGPGESEIAEFIRGKLESYGLTAKLQVVKDRRANVIGVLKGKGGGPSLMLNGHIDTVGVTEMMVDPFGASVDRQGRLHGRGACDMKGSIASMMAAIKSITDSGTHLRGDVIFTGVIDEEYRSIGTRAVIREHRSDAAIVGEPTGLDVAIAHKGFVWIEVEVKGRASHGSVPEKGLDAIAMMAKLVSHLSELQASHAEIYHPLLGNPKLHTSTIEGGTEWSIVPESCRLHLERRTLPGERKDVAVEEIQRVVDKLSAEDPEFNAAVKKFFEQSAMEVPRTESVIRAVSTAYGRVTKRKARFVGVPYWTDAALLVNDAKVPACLFGPGDIRLAHSVDEYVSVEEVATAADVFKYVIEIFCGSGSNK